MKNMNAAELAVKYARDDLLKDVIAILKEAKSLEEALKKVEALKQ